MQLLAELRRRGWKGRLVLAGPTPPRGNSFGTEAAARLRDPSLRSHVVTLGDLTEPEKNWLYSRAALTLYPSASEGFGLVPFESARRKVPVLTSRQGSLDEILPRDVMTLEGYDVVLAADQAFALLDDQAMAGSSCDRINAHAGQFTWERTAAEVLALVDDVVRRPPNRVASIWGETMPVVLDHPRPFEGPSERSERLERLLQRMLRAEKVKRAALPPGSRRQHAARRTANWMRRTSGAR